MTNLSSEIKMASQEHGVLAYGEEVIHYDIIRKARESSSYNTVSNGEISPKASRKVIIKVYSNQRVVATVPHDTPNEAIQDAIIKRARWIWQSIKEFATQHDYVLAREYVSGETQFYLGRRYVLKVISQPNEDTSVKLLRGRLEVTLRNVQANRSKQVKTLIDRWYLHHAKNVFRERLQTVLPKVTWVKEIPSFKIMTMKKQWGSCSTKGSLMLNPHLVKASKECIDYVILHELCHISEHNHSDKFWRLLTQVMPNWKEVKSKLDGMAELYLNE